MWVKQNKITKELKYTWIDILHYYSFKNKHIFNLALNSTVV